MEEKFGKKVVSRLTKKIDFPVVLALLSYAKVQDFF